MIGCSSDLAQVRAFDTVNTFCEPERQTKCHLFPTITQAAHVTVSPYK